MLKRPDLRNPSDFGDIFTVLLAVVVTISVFSVIIEHDWFGNVIVVLLTITFGWIAWAVHNILVEHTEQEDETSQ